jgi:hypothetical protein
MSDVLPESVEVSDEGSVSETPVEVKSESTAGTPAALKKRGRPKSTTPKAPKAPKAPRVKKSEAERRSSAVAGALTSAEHDLVTARAAAANLTVSRYVGLAALAYVHPGSLYGLTDAAKRLY